MTVYIHSRSQYLDTVAGISKAWQKGRWESFRLWLAFLTARGVEKA